MRAILLLTSCCVLLGAACAGDEEPRPRATQTPTVAASIEDRPSELVYMHGKRLSVVDLETDRRQVVATLPSADVAISPDGTRFVVTGDQSGQPIGDEGFIDPTLILAPMNQKAGAPEILGPGRDPHWSPDGSFIAAVHDDGIAVYDADGGAGQEPAIVIGPGEWTITGWGPAGVVGVPFGPGEAAVAGPTGTGEAEELGYASHELWGISPTDAAALLVEDGRTVLVTGDGSEATVDLGAATPGEGSWAPDGERIAVAAIAGGGENRMALIDAASGEVTEVPESDGAQGDVIWSADSSWFGFVKVSSVDPGSLEAVVCSVDLDCGSELTWKEGVDLLALKGQSSDDDA